MMHAAVYVHLYIYACAACRASARGAAAVRHVHVLYTQLMGPGGGVIKNSSVDVFESPGVPGLLKSPENGCSCYS